MLNESFILWILGFIWIFGAIIQDLQRREVDNLWNFSLVAIAFFYRISVSIYLNDFNFLIQGVWGFLFFLVLGNLLYNMRVFAGGDTKLLIALGPVLFFGPSFSFNVRVSLIFISLFLILGSIYSLIWAVVLMFKNFKNFKKEFLMNFIELKKLFLIFVLLFVVSVILSFFNWILILFGLIGLLFPFLFVFAKSIEEVCLVKILKVNELTEGEWLYGDVKVGKKVVKANWNGVTKEEIELIKKFHKKVKVKQGIPFTPSFLFAFIVLAWYYF